MGTRGPILLSMAISTPQPTLYKPKSKIRLRLGLTPPHPKPKQPETVHVPAVPSLQASIASQTPSSTSTPNPTSSFNASTNTVSSQPSRADSRDAFAYDHDNSPESINFTQSPAVDVISYISTSPVSVKRVAPIPNPLISSHRAVASPMPLEENTHPHITAAASADDIFSLTDQQLADRFSFISEIGFGNWGSVWLCKPKHVRSSALGTSGKTGMVRLGKMAAAGGGSGAGGKVAIKLVHRSKTPVSEPNAKPGFLLTHSVG